MELEVKHLAPYLPYGLKVLHCTDKDFPKKEALLTISDYNWLIKQSYFKPMLRPLSDLTKEIEHNGEKFIPINELEKGENGSIYSLFSSDGNNTQTITITYKMMGDTFTDYIINRNSIENTDYKYVQKLFEWKFDVFSLIENGLAVAVTETFNHYK